jgi:hypothetical protein
MTKTVFVILVIKRLTNRDIFNQITRDLKVT